MRCTNYSIDPFKSIANTYNKAAADYVAALLESQEFIRWYGSEKAPAIRNMQITNAGGKVWDLKQTLNVWKKNEDIRQGFRNKDGELITHDASEPGILKRLTQQASWYNGKTDAFKARVSRRSLEGQEVYVITSEFNKDFEKSRFTTALSERPTLETEDNESFFYLRNYDPKVFAEGTKTVSIRPDAYQEGVYQIGNEFFRVTLRSNKPMNVKDAKEGKAALRQAFIQDDAIEYAHIQDFFDGKLNMFIYDIQKLKLSEKQAKALPDFVGAMSIKVNKKAPGAKHLTGYADIDKYIETLLDAKTSLYRQRSAVKKDIHKVQEIDNRIDSINKQIERLKADADVSTLFAVGRNILFQLQKDIKHSNTFTDIDNGIRLAKAWAELGKVIDFAQEAADEETRELLKEANDIRALAQTLFDEYFKKYKTKLLEAVDARIAPKEDGKGGFVKASETLVDKEGNFIFNDISKLSARHLGKSFSSNALMQFVDQMLNEADYKAQQETYQFEVRLDQAVRDLFGKSAHQLKPEELNFMFDNGRMITKYDSSFYKELYIKRYLTFEKGRMKPSNSDNYNAAIALGATADDFKSALTFKEYYEWERKHFRYELTEDGKKAFEQFMEQEREANIIGTDEDGNFIYDEEAIEATVKEFDPKLFQDFLDGKSKKANKGNKWFTKILEKAPVNKKYAAMTAKQVAFYNFYTSEFLAGQQDLVIDHRFGEADLDRELMDFVLGVRSDLKGKLSYLGNNLKEAMKDIYSVRYFDETTVKNTRSPITGLERKGAEFRIISSFTADPNKKGATNPLEVLTSFRRWGHLFKHKREIEDILQAAKDAAHEAENVGRTPDGRLRNTAAGRLFTSKQKTNLADWISYNIDAGLTGKRKDPMSVDGKGKPGERVTSLEQFADKVNNYTRVKNMALSPLSATGNFVMGSVNNFIYAASGEYYNEKELRQAYWILKENVLKGVFASKVVTPTARKIAEIMRRYTILGDVTEELYHENDVISALFVWQKSGEFMNQGATAIAQMLRTKVKMKDGITKSLYDLFEMDKNNKLQYRSDLLADDEAMKDDHNLFRFFEKVKKVNMKIHGDYTNPLMAKKDLVGRIYLMFRTWLPMAIKERFGAEYTDELLGKQKGRFRSFGNVAATAIKEKDWNTVARLLGKLMLPFIGRKIKLGDNISEVDRNNLQMFMREMHFWMMLTASVIFLKAQIDDEDDENEKNVLRYLYNQAERAQSELSFFFLPKDTMQIIRDVAPIYSTLEDGFRVLTRTGNLLVGGDDEYQKGFRKGDSKTWKAVQDFVPVMRSFEKASSAMHQIYSDSRYQ